MPTYDEFVKASAAFRLDLLDPETPFPDRDGGWLSVRTRVACGTDGCRLGTVETVLHVNADGVYRVQCGLCEHAITDVVGIFDDGEHRLPA